MEDERGIWEIAAKPAAVGKGICAPSPPPSHPLVYHHDLSDRLPFHTPLASHPAPLPGSKSISAVDIQLITTPGPPKTTPCENATTAVAPQKRSA